MGTVSALAVHRSVLRPGSVNDRVDGSCEEEAPSSAAATGAGARSEFVPPDPRLAQAARLTGDCQRPARSGPVSLEEPAASAALVKTLQAAGVGVHEMPGG